MQRWKSRNRFTRFCNTELMEKAIAPSVENVWNRSMGKYVNALLLRDGTLFNKRLTLISYL